MRVQNRRNVQVGSRNNQSKPLIGTDGFLHHTRLGLVGWISYWCLGDSALAVDILVALTNTLGLTDLVSEVLTSREQKQVETNTKIVDLFKEALDDVFLLCFLVYRGTMRGGRSAVGARHARVSMVEDTDPTPVDRISWKVVRAPSRPFGQKTNLLSQHHQGFGIVT
jgi:hypothetical protein